MAIHLRRNNLEPRIEMMPLLDVVFLLLTFFIYAMVMMVRAHLLPVQLPTVGQGEGDTPSIPAFSITVDQRGELFLDAKAATIEDLVPEVLAFREVHPAGRVYLAADMVGETDRLPLFIEVINQLRTSGLNEFFIVGQPESEQTQPPLNDSAEH